MKMQSDNAALSGEILALWHRTWADLPEALMGRRSSFLTGGPGFFNVLEKAETVRQKAVAAGGNPPTLILGAEDRDLTAAALLGAMAARARLVIPSAGFGEILEAIRRQYPGAEVLWDAPGVPGQALSRLSVEPDQPLVELFTGGSTGLPRKWEKSAANLLGEACLLAALFGVTEKDSIVSAVSPRHIYGLLFTVCLPLVAGARVAGPTPGFPAEIERQVAEASATVLVAAPPHYRLFRGKKADMPDLRRAFSSGGFLSSEDSLSFTRHTGTGVTEIYGSTETGGIASRCRARGESAWTPFPVIEWKTAAQRLLVRSPFLFPGLAPGPGGFFTTGDCVKARGPASFDLIGRVDGIVKVGGKRVSLDAVEEAAKALPWIQDACVVALDKDSPRGKELAVMAVSGEPKPAEELRRHLVGALEPAALPRRVLWVPALPRTAAGKVDRPAVEKAFRETK